MPQIYKQSAIRHTHPRNVEVTLLWDRGKGGWPGLSASGQGLAGPLEDANKIQRHRQWERLRLLGASGPYMGSPYSVGSWEKLLYPQKSWACVIRGLCPKTFTGPQVLPLPTSY